MKFNILFCIFCIYIYISKGITFSNSPKAQVINHYHSEINIGGACSMMKPLNQLALLKTITTEISFL